MRGEEMRGGGGEGYIYLHLVTLEGHAKTMKILVELGSPVDLG